MVGWLHLKDTLARSEGGWGEKEKIQSDLKLRTMKLIGRNFASVFLEVGMYFNFWAA